MNKEYYDILLGQDLSVYASYYEPWGYTQLESVAFHVPTITTDLAGFGRWVNSLKNQHGINDGVEAVSYTHLQKIMKSHQEKRKEVEA